MSMTWRLFFAAEYWYPGEAGQGYGSNNFHYTYAIGGEQSAGNWVHWYMGHRAGRQEIQVICSTQASHRHCDIRDLQEQQLPN